jgi:hypothetical protein
MKREMKWITIWMLMSIVMGILSLTYFYLNHELALHGMSVLGLLLIAIIFPYSLWKYNEIKFVGKKQIVIQFLND